MGRARVVFFWVFVTLFGRAEQARSCVLGGSDGLIGPRGCVLLRHIEVDLAGPSGTWAAGRWAVGRKDGPPA